MKFIKRLFGCILVLLIAAVIVICICVNKLMDPYQYDANFNSSGLNQEIINSSKPVDNIMLFGVDADDNGTRRSDAMMIMSLDYKEHKIKLTSLMRDSYVDIPGHGMDKLTHAYSYGGPELAISTINKNFGLDISEYATVDFQQMASIIDAVGGVEIDVSEAERKEANKYIGEYGRTYGVDVQEIESDGLQTLDGIQAMTYGRIRKNGTGDDWGRVERQSVVLQAIFNKLQNVSPITLYHTMETILPNVTSSVSKGEAISIFRNFILHFGKPTMEHTRIPVDGEWDGKKIHGVYYTVFDVDDAADEIYDFIYKDIMPVGTTE